MPTKREAIAMQAESLIGSGYIYGATGWICTRARMRQQAQQYPMYAETIERYGPRWLGKPCYDCAQLTRAAARAAGISMPSGSTSQWRNASLWTQKGRIAAMPDEAGLFVFTLRDGIASHTAVTLGAGETVDARGHAYGVVRRRISDASYTHWARLAVEYDAPVETINPPAAAEKAKIRSGARGEDVVLLQQFLLDHGYDLGRSGVDGRFGSMTRTALIRFQRDFALQTDGIAGPSTWGMIRALSA